MNYENYGLNFFNKFHNFHIISRIHKILRPIPPLRAAQSLEIRQKWRVAQVARRMVHKERQKVAQAANNHVGPRKKVIGSFHA